MKISFQWLKEFVDPGLSPRELAARLTMTGLAVDAVTPEGDDFILEFDLTSNRPDCLSHLGIAREAAVVTGRPLRLPEGQPAPGARRTEEATSVEILDSRLCPRYAARVIRGVKVGPSPAWLAARLAALGQRSVNNVADITNYILLEQGQPLHAFDFNRLRGRRIVVRTAQPGERLETLDGVMRELTPEMLIIADADRPVALAGIMGGADSEISGATSDVLLESAYFDPVSIRQTARALGMSTEASYRFERGADCEAAARACDRAAAMIAEIAGGEVLAGIVDVYPGRLARGPILFRRARYRDLTGLEVELGEAARILGALGFAVEAEVGAEALRAVAPSWRVDVGIEEDLIEEVARISGYDQLRMTLPGGAGAGAYLVGEGGRRAARRALTGMGYHEAINFSFVSAETDAIFGAGRGAGELTLSNPIDETQAQLRTTLLGGVLDAVARNFNHGTRGVRLFEMGKCFSPADGGRPVESELLALAATGARNETDWQRAAERVDFYDLKGAVEAVGEALGLPRFEFEPIETASYLHPGRAAVISLGGKEVGRLGQLHPRAAATYKFKQPVLIAELDFGDLLAADPAEARYSPLAKFPTVVRDLSLLVDEAVTYAAIERAVAALGIPELASVRLFDLYVGRELPAGKHSVALSLRYRAADRTLTEAEISAAHERVTAMLGREFGAELR